MTLPVTVPFFLKYFSYTILFSFYSVIVPGFKNGVEVSSLLKYTPVLEIQCLKKHRCDMDKYFANVPYHCTSVPQTKFDNKAV